MKSTHKYELLGPKPPYEIEPHIIRVDEMRDAIAARSVDDFHNPEIIAQRLQERVAIMKANRERHGESLSALADTSPEDAIRAILREEVRYALGRYLRLLWPRGLTPADNIHEPEKEL